MTKQKNRAEASVKDLNGYIESFPAHDWLLRYWYEHYNDMEIEYEAHYSKDTLTAQKYSLLLQRNPGFLPDYATEQDIEKLTEEDQKLYAEIEYSRLISRIDQMKEVNQLSYVFGVVTEHPYDRQNVLFISANPGDVRGNEEGQVYPIGSKLAMTEERQAAVLNAMSGEPGFSLNEDGTFLDYYYPVSFFDSHDVLIAVAMYIPEVELSFQDSVSMLGFMSVAFMILLSQLIRSGRTAAAVLQEAYDSLCARNPEEMFITVWLGILDLTTGVMTCANAGHEYPMLRKAGGDIRADQRQARICAWRHGRNCIPGL